MSEFFSPNHQYMVSICSTEIRMSHWIDQPCLVRVSDNKTLFELEHLWSGSGIQWVNDSTVTLYLRLYPGLLACDLTLDVAANQGSVSGEAGSFTGTIPEVEKWINRLENPSELYRY